jgi:putative endonuclease
MHKQYFVYIMTNKSGTLYTGVTNDLGRRVWQHKEAVREKRESDIRQRSFARRWWAQDNKGGWDKRFNFTARYNITRLIYYEVYDDPENAIVREKQIKGWLRKKKIALIKTMNPGFKDLAEELSS